MAGFDRGHDAELDRLFGDDPELLRLSERLRAARPEPALDPRFKAVLRARVMDAAERELRPRPVLLRKPWFLRGGPIAFGGGALGAAMIAAAVLSLLVYHPQDTTTSPSASSTASGVAQLDPSSAIRVSFTKPMDPATVLRSLDIHPATSYTATWTGGNTQLTIVPTHRLAGNTAYMLTIGRAMARDASGRAPQQDIHFSFGTAPTPVPAGPGMPVPTPAPDFAVNTLGPAAAGSHVEVAPDGSVVSGGAPGSASATDPPAASAPTGGSTPAAPSPSASPGTSASASPPGSPAGASLTRYPVAGSPIRLGSGGGTVAVSGDGRLIAGLVPSGTGAAVTVVDVAGGPSTNLGAADSSDGPLAWTAPDTLAYVGGGRLRSVNLQGGSRTLAPQTLGQGQTVVLAAQGHTAYLGPAPGQSGELLDLGSLQATPLPGASTQVVFSGDGTRVAWVDHPGGGDRVQVAPITDLGTATTVATLRGADTVRGIALSAHGRRAAVSHSTGALRAVEVTSGTLLASTTLDLEGGLAWSPSGDRLAAVRHDPGGDSLVVALLPGTSAAQALPDGVPPAATAALSTFLKAQISGGDLSAVASPGLDTSGLHPAGLSRDYVIRAALGADGAVRAEIRLVADPAGGSPARSATESVSLSERDGRWLVSSAGLGRLQADPTGPQIVHVVSAVVGNQTTVQASFDSDLDPKSVPAAVTIRAADGTVVDAVVRYQAEVRTIVAVVSSPPSGSLQIVIGTQLRDVSGQHLAGEYHTSS